MSAPNLPPPSGTLADDMRGLWWLMSREDWTPSGERRIDPVLGPDPVAIVTYGSTHFAAQFMKRDRTQQATGMARESAENNTSAIDGYDAYFGTYSVDESTGKVTHTLLGSVVPSNIGLVVSRDIRVDGQRLILQLETKTADGEPIVRSLTWSRLD